MPLTLKITSRQKDLLGPEGIHVFSVHGGSIGRAPDNDWVLPDPERYVSAHHAVIDHQGGAYYIRDTSTNGVFVNDSDQPVGPGTPLRLHDGDRLRMGRYLFSASIVNVSRDGMNDSGVFATGDPATTRREAPEPELEPELELALNLELLEEREAGGRPSAADTATMSMEEEIGVAEPAADDARDEAQEVPAATQTAETRHLGGFGPGLAILLEGIGVSASRVPEGHERRFLLTLGHLLRSAIGGLQQVLHGRARVKHSMGLSQTGIRPKENNPLKTSQDLDRTLDDLLFYKGIHYMPAVDAVEEAHRDVLAHQKALVTAMEAAFHDLLGRFEPDVLEVRFQRGLRRGALLGMSNRAKYWDLYREYYATVARRSDASFEEIVGKVFAKEYEAEIRRLRGEVPAADTAAD